MTDDELEERPNPPRRGLRKGLYLIPSVFTAGNIGMGFFSVMASLRGFQLLGTATPDIAGATAHFDRPRSRSDSPLLFDMLDGRIARLTKTTTEIGIQLDSIADVVTFGLAPAVLGLCLGIWSNASGRNRSSSSRVVSIVHVSDLRGVSVGAFQRAGVAPAHPR